MAHLNKMSGLVQKLKGNPGSNPNARKKLFQKGSKLREEEMSAVELSQNN